MVAVRAMYGAVLAGMLAWTSLSQAATSAGDSGGERLYRQGILPGGAPVVAERQGGIEMRGADVACVNCHRRSGLGTAEGRTIIPPIIGKYLFRSSARNVEDMDLPHVPGFNATRAPYTDATLAEAIRNGVAPGGRKLNYLMPRYRLDDAAMTTLIGYLKNLTAAPVPGVTDTTLHFATVVTPDADPVERDAMLRVLQDFFTDKNVLIGGQGRRLQTSREIMYRVERRWQLHVWTLEGAPDTWERQLDAKLAAEPVFALISGIGRHTWAPIHRFCERAGVPCLLPNIDLPVVAEDDFYPVYYSKGVLLEAELAAHRIRTDGEASGPRRLVQVFRRDDIGADAARAASAALSGAKVEVVDRVVDGTAPAAIDAALADLRAGDTALLWLRGGDLAALPAPPSADVAVLVSGSMGGLESAPLPPAWRGRVRMLYPFDLPDQRKVRMNFPLGWFKVRHIPVTAERVQTDTYLACQILSETLGEMLDSFVRDYLVERVEIMLSHRLVNGYFPRLGLAPGQRFASKGGYVARFAAEGTALVADGEWTVP